MVNFVENYKVALTVQCPLCLAGKGKNCRDRLRDVEFGNRSYHPQRLEATKAN